MVLKTSWNLATSCGFSVRPICSNCLGSIWGKEGDGGQTKILFEDYMSRQAQRYSYLKSKKGLDTVGSIQTVQAVGPHSPPLSPKTKQRPLHRFHIMYTYNLIGDKVTINSCLHRVLLKILISLNGIKIAWSVIMSWIETLTQITIRSNS